MSKGTALVTGASSGIGAVYADRLAKRGYNLVLVARNAGRLDQLATDLSTQYGVAVTAFPADLTNHDDLENVAARLATGDDLTLVVNSAGIGPNANVLASDPDSLRQLVFLNVDILHRLTLSAAHNFVDRGRGAIINIASVVPLMPERFNASYCASKAFVLSLTQSLASEIGPRGVQMQAVLPGFTRTELFERAGLDINVIPPEMMMDAGDMVDAALAGFDQGELITIPSLADPAMWDAMETARHAIAPFLSLAQPAPRYANRAKTGEPA
ncbi:SDR family NAD(P)-dependent oxidoreductase [Thalassospira xiamenensis]|uniref:AraC family transcriptional regulator n=1 Tax=Thalassospira xiamenensis TaxID=220697 RepID=A0A367WT51_9PROT|nr:SDR family oxidoreductase [Thalassospira xiamenensis]KZB50768.1 AraC family transcriptional regulator [Thalassospira xiamenensis]RCK44389.1 AraC family transcriptional regulator [Thalassospira xiamenensis]